MLTHIYNELYVVNFILLVLSLKFDMLNILIHIVGITLYVRCDYDKFKKE